MHVPFESAELLKTRKFFSMVHGKFFLAEILNEIFLNQVEISLLLDYFIKTYQIDLKCSSQKFKVEKCTK